MAYRRQLMLHIFLNETFYLLLSYTSIISSTSLYFLFLQFLLSPCTIPWPISPWHTKAPQTKRTNYRQVATTPRKAQASSIFHLSTVGNKMRARCRKYMKHHSCVQEISPYRVISWDNKQNRNRGRARGPKNALAPC